MVRNAIFYKYFQDNQLLFNMHEIIIHIIFLVYIYIALKLLYITQNIVRWDESEWRYLAMILAYNAAEARKKLIDGSQYINVKRQLYKIYNRIESHHGEVDIIPVNQWISITIVIDTLLFILT